MGVFRRRHDDGAPRRKASTRAARASPTAGNRRGRRGGRGRHGRRGTGVSEEPQTAVVRANTRWSRPGRGRCAGDTSMVLEPAPRPRAAHERPKPTPGALSNRSPWGAAGVHPGRWCDLTPYPSRHATSSGARGSAGAGRVHVTVALPRRQMGSPSARSPWWARSWASCRLVALVDGEVGFGVQGVSEPAHPDLVDVPDALDVVQRVAGLVDERGVDGVHEAAEHVGGPRPSGRRRWRW